MTTDCLLLLTALLLLLFLLTCAVIVVVVVVVDVVAGVCGVWCLWSPRVGHEARHGINHRGITTVVVGTV